jgi:hypothetical protein
MIISLIGRVTYVEQAVRTLKPLQAAGKVVPLATHEISWSCSLNHG